MRNSHYRELIWFYACEFKHGSNLLVRKLRKRCQRNQSDLDMVFIDLEKSMIEHQKR